MQKDCQTTFETAACIPDSAKPKELHQQMIAHYKILSCHCFGQFQYKELTTELHNNRGISKSIRHFIRHFIRHVTTLSVTLPLYPSRYHFSRMWTSLIILTSK